MKQFMYILHLTPHYMQLSNWGEESNATIGNHFNYLKDLHAKGVMKMVGRTDLSIEDNDNHGIAIFVAENEDAALEIMNNDPAVVNGLMTAKLYPFSIALL
jgi:uncharacterized protein YciI